MSLKAHESDPVPKTPVYCRTAVQERRLWEGGPLRELREQLAEERRDAQRRGRRPNGRKESEIAIHLAHLLANEIVALAKRYEAQVVLEQLKGLRSRALSRARSRRRRDRLSKMMYQKLASILSYKLPLAGLWRPWHVSPAWTSLTCAVCRHRDKASRHGREFQCVACGHQDDADLNAAINLGRRWFEEKAKREKAGV